LHSETVRLYHLSLSYQALEPTATRKRSTSRKRSVEEPEPTEGYSCTLYKDYLVFFGGLYNGRAIDNAYVYNLKEGMMERVQQNMKRLSLPTFDHAALYYERQNSILFIGGKDEQEATRSRNNAYPALHFRDKEGNILSLKKNSHK